MSVVWSVVLRTVALVSLGVALCACALWIRSSSCRDTFCYEAASGAGWSIDSVRGGIQIGRMYPASFGTGWFVEQPANSVIGRRVGGFGAYFGEIPPYNGQEIKTRIDVIVVPSWAVVSLSLVIPWVVAVRFVRRRTARQRGFPADARGETRSSA